MAQLHSQSPAPSPPTSATHRAEAGKNAMANAIKVYRELLEIPEWKRALFLPTGGRGATLQLDSSTRSTSQLNKSSSTQSLSLDGTSVVSTSPLIFTSGDVVHTCHSVGSRSAVFRTNKHRKGVTVELWDVLEGTKLEELDVGKDHGDCYFDDTFGPPVLSPDGLSVLYAAEPLAPTSEETIPPRSTYEYTPDFGELFTGKRFPSLFLLTFTASPFQTTFPAKPTVHPLSDHETFPDVSFGQAILLPCVGGVPRIISTGYSALADSRKLGIVYCTNRPAAIYELKLEKVAEKWKATSATRQSPEGRSARSPRVLVPSPGARFAPLVVFLSNVEGGPHSGCASLHAAELKSGRTTVLVNPVDKPKSLAEFPGVFTEQLPQNPFVVLKGVPHVVFTTSWRSRRVPLLVSLANGAITSLAEWPTPLDDPVLPYLGSDKREALKSLSVLGTNGDSLVVALRSGMVSPPELVIIDLVAPKRLWKVLKSARLSPHVSAALEKLDWTVLPLPKFEPSEIILLSPCQIDPAAEASVTLPPLITIPHGGPHSVYATSWSTQFICLAVAGYRVGIVNYPGSTGFGQEFVDALPPRLGQLEVDATLATSHYLNALSLASRTKGSRFFMGGSHGGFIGTHLSGKYPEEYDAVVLRNPVTDLASMVFGTDIPDWSFEEAVVPYPFAAPPSSVTPTQNSHLHSISPLSKASDVTVPTLLLVGKSDRRVPPDQSRAWFHALKKNKVGEVDMLIFTDNGHALDSNVETEIVAFEEGLKWIERFTVW